MAHPFQELISPASPNLSLQDFSAAREWHEDLNAVGCDDAGPGYLYPGGLFIEKVTKSWSDKAQKLGGYYLMLERDEFFGPLDVLEARLYDYGARYGYFDDLQPIRIIN